MKRSRSIQLGLAGLWRISRVNSVYATGARPIGAPGCPELAFWTASIDSVRIVLMHSSSSSVPVSVVVIGAVRIDRYGPRFSA